MDNFSNRLSLLIKENKTKKKVLAEAIGLSAQAITEMTKGRSNASLQTIRSIANHYKVSEEWLEYGTGEKEPKFEVVQVIEAAGPPKINGQKPTPARTRLAMVYELLNEETDEELEDLISKLLHKKKARCGDSQPE